MQRLVPANLANDAFKFFDVREMTVGMVPATVIRASYTGDLGYEIWVTPDYQVTLYEQLLEAGSDLGLRHFGSRALTSLRLEKGYGAFLREFRPDYTPMESGLARFVSYGKADFIGIVGGICGLIIGHLLGALGSVFLKSLLGQGINWVRVDQWELLYLAGVSILAALAGLVPALSAYRTPVATNLVAS